jgi:NADH:ubiquinone oxidoreductase subunit F (NADH-binding)
MSLHPSSGAMLPRLLAGLDPAGRRSDLGAHQAAYGPIPRLSANHLFQEVAASGLRGRGGADFPTARKLAALADERVVSALVVNGSETEPASQKDLVLMSALPHLVLDGARLAAGAIGANGVIVRLGPRGASAAEALRQAIAQRAAELPIRIVEGPGGYVTGEESAVIQHLGGGPAKPTFIPPRPYQRGYQGRPTLVLNPETLAHLALIARFGADWFRELGTADDPGTCLTTISGAVTDPGVYELAFGTPVRDLLTLAGGQTEPIQAVLVGGYFGSWVSWPATDGLTLTREELAAAGLALGAGVVIALGESACGLHESAALAGYLAGESSGQCGPCVHGLAAMAASFAALAAGRAPQDEDQRVRRWTAELPGRGACHHPDGAARLLRSSLDTFGFDIARHRAGRCDARPAGLPGLQRIDVTSAQRSR